MSLEEHRLRLRDALLGALFLRAKLRAELGAVPREIEARIAELTRALGDCTAAIQRQWARRAVERASERAIDALAGVEVDLGLI